MGYRQREKIKFSELQGKQYNFELVPNLNINKYHEYGIDLLYDPENDVYAVSIFGTLLDKLYYHYSTCYKDIYKITVQYMQYNKPYIEDFLKSNDYI